VADPLAFVESMNLMRRYLTAEYLAVRVADAAPELAMKLPGGEISLTVADEIAKVLPKNATPEKRQQVIDYQVGMRYRPDQAPPWPYGLSTQRLLGLVRFR
jgi:hypothetical protein